MRNVPIDVLAHRLGTSRGAVYQTPHDARRLIRARLERCGPEQLADLAGTEHDPKELRSTWPRATCGAPATC